MPLDLAAEFAKRKPKPRGPQPRAAPRLTPAQLAELEADRERERAERKRRDQEQRESCRADVERLRREGIE